MFFLVFVFTLVFIMLGVAFFTLLERKVLSYMQFRKGPNKMGFVGMLQPFADAIKLFSKEISKPKVSNFNIFVYMPMIGLVLSLMMWVLLPSMFSFFFVNLGVIFFLCLSSMSVYTVILGSWSSNSNYAMLGSLRCIAQMISYEISLSMIFMCCLVLINSMNFYDMIVYQETLSFIFFYVPVTFMWIISCMAETNRSPFDFSEGESELVSGFNTEFSSVLFSYVFLSEYCSIMFMSVLTVTMFLGAEMFSAFFYMKFTFVCFFFVWVRGSLPRFRYDKLMFLNWKVFLPVVMSLILWFSGFSMMIKLEMN